MTWLHVDSAVPSGWSGRHQLDREQVRRLADLGGGALRWGEYLPADETRLHTDQTVVCTPITDQTAHRGIKPAPSLALQHVPGLSNATDSWVQHPPELTENAESPILR
ncbi:hypothetical protein E4U21_005523 [Claviceps maximensis]|nr:hypothetical protein E4U21_005523 [Claviceps maximensis]